MWIDVDAQINAANKISQGFPVQSDGGYGGGYGGAPAMAMGYGGNPMMGGMGGASDFGCVRLRGVPFDAYDHDVRMFLGCEVVDVLMCRKNGRMSGEAIVVFPSAFNAQMSLQKNGQNMGRRYIEIFPATKQEYYKAIAQTLEGGGGKGGFGPEGGPGADGAEGAGGPMGGGGPPPRDVEHTGILKMRGLPFEATKENIIEWFGDAAVQPPVALEADSVLICQNFSGRPSGVAFARFAGAEEAQAAAAMDRKMFGRRYVELFPAQPEDWEREVAKEQGNSGGGGGAPAAAAPAPTAEADE